MLALGIACDGSVDGGASDAEEVGEFRRAVFAGVVQRDEVRFLALVELWRPAS